ncbi:MAG: hypothetical protein JRN20_19380 [Nitrososphaerota archaeon]|nr:hypothetical protein [Nitrososphaerota archaeon]
MSASKPSQETSKRSSGRHALRTFASEGTIFWLGVLAFHYFYVGASAIHQPGIAGEGSNGYLLLIFAVIALVTAFLCWNSLKVGFVVAIALPLLILVLSALQGADFMFSEAVFGTMINFLILFFGIKTYAESFIYKAVLPTERP